LNPKPTTYRSEVLLLSFRSTSLNRPK